jgi:hypothetical protein
MPDHDVSNYLHLKGKSGIGLVSLTYGSQIYT